MFNSIVPLVSIICSIPMYEMTSINIVNSFPITTGQEEVRDNWNGPNAYPMLQYV